MKLITSFICLCALFVCFWSCKNKTATTQQNIPNVKVEEPATTITALDGRLNNIDSIVINFYKDPYSKDSVRYTRFYTQAISTDTIYFSSLISNLDAPFTKLEKIKNCRSEGKMWCYSKGKIFQTIFFSSKCPDCCFLYLIKDGFFYYVQINDSMIKKLESLKKTSQEPAA